jgi:Tetratricopeptide repeat.
MTNLNLNTYFGEDLRAYPESAKDVLAYIEQEISTVTDLTGSEKFKRLSRVAVKLGQVQEYAKAHVHFSAAADFFSESSAVMSMLNFIRWADIFRFEKRFDEALEKLNRAEALLTQNQFSEYEDFFNQHKGKLYFDKGEYAQALKHFEKAMLLRAGKKDSELIASTDLAIKITKLKLQ